MAPSRGSTSPRPYLGRLPVGDDADGTWLIALGPGDVLPVLGEAAPALWRAARRPPAPGRGRTPSSSRRIPGIPASLGSRPSGAAPVASCSVGIRARARGSGAALAMVTVAPVAASDLTVLVDRRGATLHPMGRAGAAPSAGAVTARHMRRWWRPPRR